MLNGTNGSCPYGGFAGGLRSWDGLLFELGPIVGEKVFQVNSSESRGEKPRKERSGMEERRSMLSRLRCRGEYEIKKKCHFPLQVR